MTFYLADLGTNQIHDDVFLDASLDQEGDLKVTVNGTEIGGVYKTDSAYGPLLKRVNPDRYHRIESARIELVTQNIDARDIDAVIEALQKKKEAGE